MNLLPKTTKQAVRADYHRRLLAVGLALLALVIGIFDGLLGLQFLGLKNDKSNVAALRTAEERVGNRQAFLAARNSLSTLNRRLKTLSLLGTTVNTPADFFTAVLDLKPAGVRLTALTYSTSTVLRGQVVVSGTADTRAHLLKFVDALKESSVFTDIVSPVDNLIREREADFIITASVK